MSGKIMSAGIVSGKIMTHTGTITRVTHNKVFGGKWDVYYRRDDDGREWWVTMRPSLRGAAPGKRIEIDVDTTSELVVSCRLAK